LRSIILDQLLNRTTKRRISFFYGARSRRDLCYVDEFDRLAAEHDNFSWQVALSDASPDELGDAARGFVHSVAHSQYLSSHPKPEAIEYYLCGPPLMSRAVIAMLEDLGVEQKQIFLDDFGS
jgi:Na+-transporting NADH:ubiquinone oxidoreductase subunit F